ncbi:MAG TPA: hypothetical protein VIL69_12810, partial [Roseomonas sp.]
MPEGHQINRLLSATGEADGEAPAGPDGKLPPHRWTFSQRLALVYGGVSLVILLCAGAFTWWQASLLSARNEELAIVETRRMAEHVGSALTQARQGISVLAAADPMERGPEACSALLNAAHLTMDAIVRHLFVISANDRVTCSTLPTAIGRPVFSSVVRTTELTGRPVIGVLGESIFGLGQSIGVGHPLRQDGRPDGAVAAAVAVEELRAAVSQHLPRIEGLRVWLLDSAGSSTSLVGPHQPLPPLPDALHASLIAPERVDAGIATDKGQFLIQ